MGIIELIVTIIIVGALLWAVNTFIPMQPTFRRAANGLAVLVLGIVVVVWLLGFLGVAVPHVHHSW